MRKIYMMTVLNLKTARDKCPPPIIDPHKTDFKVGRHGSFEESHPNYSIGVIYMTSYQICK